MEGELDSDVIRATQLSLGKFVKKPPLTEKLLKKPPFRFLHDIITNVLSTTGFLEGLFEEEELISDNVKDRETKILFLNKVITVLGLITGKSLKAKPSKIIAGQEPANTNELLQCLGEALEKKLSSEEAVKKYKETTKITVSHDKRNKDAVKGLKKNNDTKKVSSKGKTANTGKDSKTILKLQQRDNSITKKDSPPKKSQSTTNVKKNRVKSPKEQKTSLSNEKKKQEKSSNINQNDEQLKSAEKKSTEDNPQINKNHESVVNVLQNEKETLLQDSEKEQTDFVDKNASNHISEATVSKTTEEDRTIILKHDDDVNNQKDLDIVPVKEEQNKKVIEETKTLLNDTKNEKNNEMENQNSSRTTHLDSNVVNIYEKRTQNVRPSSSRPGAPRVKDKYDAAVIGNENPIVHKVNIIEENTLPEEEEDGSIIIVDNQAGSISTSQNEEQMQLSSNHHGHLVQQILDSQKEFSQISGKTEIEWQFGAQKARDVINQEIEQIRFNVQALSRVSNPLGKLIDHVQEDVEVMRQELQEWIKKYEETSKELIKQKVANTESLQPLQAKIKQLDAEIEEKREKINDLRIVVFKNFYRIEKLLSSGSVQ
ncbi:unnamed protein product [Parnassius apollo]|uniref:TRAF3-interacting protein 1 n=1 Tax=Parnassius apollo TaxID=110799 RepID=A0A8S3WD91_PARAO|nr:unnamed protein product [Parnassius apollo]